MGITVPLDLLSREEAVLGALYPDFIMALWVLFCRDASEAKYVVFRVPETHKDSEL